MATVHHSTAGAIWRFRTEATTLTTVILTTWGLVTVLTAVWAVLTLSLTMAAVTAVPWTRRQAIRRAWCVLSRHRIQRVCWETRMHTRSGRLPLVLRISPTQVGERALIWCRAGICADDFAAHAAEIAAACYARQARIEGSKNRAQLVTVDVVRRDTLGPRHVIPSGLHQQAATRNRPESAA